jgi:site-specific recombinase XerD
MEVIDKNPETLFSINMPTIHRSEEDDISNEDIKKILKKINNSRDFAIVSFMLYNGLRRSEICNMKFGDIDKRNEVYVLNIIGKGDKLRTIVIHEVSWMALMKYLKESGKTGKQKKDTYIFTTIHDKKLCGNDIYNVIRKLALLAGLVKIHPHMFRAKYASMAIEAGVPITSVQYALGHASIETTAIYDHAKRSIERGKEVSRGVKEIK